MSITKINNILVETPINDDDQFLRTGCIQSDSFAVVAKDRLKQIKFDPSATSSNVSVTFKSAAATATNIILTLPSSSGTLATGSGVADAFAIIQPDTGTSPTAVGSSTLTVTSSDSSITILGSSSTNTLTLTAKVYTTPTTGSVFVGATPNGGMSGTFNLALGSGALSSATSGAVNTAIGANAGNGIATGTRDVIIGANTGGGQDFSFCTLIGYGAVNGTGSANVAIGDSAGVDTGSTAAGCTYVGTSSGMATTGNFNTGFGYKAGFQNTSGAANIFLGAQSGDANLLTLSNQFMAGSEAYPANTVTFGKGYSSATATAYTISGVRGFGSNNAGADLQLAGGVGTGSATPGNVVIQTGVAGGSSSTLQSLTTRVTIAPTATTFAGDVKLGTAGNKLYVKTGTNASAGTATLSGGTITVTTTACTTSSLVFVQDRTGGANIGTCTVAANSGNFVVTSTNVLDSSAINWFIVEPA